MNDPVDPRSIQRLLHIMARLRDPESGCPWDREQRFETIAPYTIEEAHEVADAVARGDLDGLRDELGDLLFQVVYHARLAEEAGAFDFGDVVKTVSDKMVRRHPHVFADATVDSAHAQRGAWEAHKANEQRARGTQPGASMLDDVGRSLPALMRAAKLQRRAAALGFDWPELSAVLEKVEEEVDELRRELATVADAQRVQEEIGDLLFTCVNVARHAGVDPEAALRAADDKFERRFRVVESRLRERGTNPEDTSLEELDALWDEIKREELKGM